MVRNPYAKKRPRLCGRKSWPSSVSTSASVVQKSTSFNPKDGAPIGTTSISLMCTSHPVHKMQPSPCSKSVEAQFTQNNANTSTDRISSTASAVNYESRNVSCNPYSRKSNIQSFASMRAAKSSIPSGNAHYLLQKVHPSQYARLSIKTNIRGVHEVKTSTASIQSRRKSANIKNDESESKVSCLVGSHIKSNFDSCVPSNIPPGMASIRPASWKSGNDRVGESSKPVVDLSRFNLTSVQSKQCTQSVRNMALENSSDCHTCQPKHKIDHLPRELSFTPDEVKPVQDEYRMLLIQNAKLSCPLKNGWVLFPHQRKAIIRALTMRRMILALDMGLGKTLIGTVWSKAFKETFGEDKLKIFVICPVSLKEEWKRTAEIILGLDVDEDGRDISKVKVKTCTKRRRKKNICQQPRESIVEKSDMNINTKMTICSWSKVPKLVESNIENFVVCCDEAHAMQSIQAQRTKDILSLVNDARCVGVLLLTGTPMKNGKPGNLFPLLKAVRHPLGRHQKAFEAHFCDGMLRNFGRGPQWVATGASNLNQLKRKVASNLLHMTKEQCLTELPPMTTIYYDVPVSSRYQIQYDNSIRYLSCVQSNSKNLRDEAVLGAVQRLRVVCAHAKVEATVEMARTILNKEPAVVIFTFFAQVAKSVHSKLKTSGWPCGLLIGETPQNKRQELVDNFQNGLLSVFVCTFGAGGVGLTLTAASTIILLDRPWTPGETRQAEDRIRRIGQVKKCTSYWMRSFDLDKQIDVMLEAKIQTTNAVLDVKQGEKYSSGPPAKISINQLVNKFVLLSETGKKC